MNMYWEYKTVLDIRIENPERAEMPSITVCTNNGIVTSKVCANSEFSDKCYTLTELLYNNSEICKCFPHFCHNGDIRDKMVPAASVVENLSFTEYENYQPYLMPFENVIPRCRATFRMFASVNESCNLDYYRNIRCHKYDELDVLHACYTIHTLIDRPNAEEEMVSTLATETLTFDSVSTEYNIKVKNPQVQISIHNSKNILNPYVYGHRLQEGYITLFRLTKTVRRLLPLPYETKCKDYLTEWKNRGGSGPTTQKECIHECGKNSSMKILGCVIQVLQGPTNEKICKDYVFHRQVLFATRDCALKHCKPACYEVTYEAIKDIAINGDTGSCLDTYWEKFSTNAVVKVKLDGMRTTTFIYSPKYQDIEIFSFLGGYMGMWLGISLVAVFDFLETLVVILKFPFRQMAKNRTRKKMMDHIRKF